ncbi:unnamed protein product [Chrysoparadoxa australica]
MLTAVIVARSQSGVFELTELATLPLTVVGWAFQEWVMHKYLLHSKFEWFGRDIHEQHHALPYMHVCIDPPSLVAAWTAVAGSIIFMSLPQPQALTCLASYMGMGLMYEWVHFLVHTRVQPRTAIGRAWKRHHTLHHLKDDRFWLAFIFPWVDNLMGTVPES